jgi:hypothetical protein
MMIYRAQSGAVSAKFKLKANELLRRSSGRPFLGRCRPVYYTDSTITGTDIAGVSNTTSAIFRGRRLLIDG